MLKGLFTIFWLVFGVRFGAFFGMPLRAVFGVFVAKNGSKHAKKCISDWV